MTGHGAGVRDAPPGGFTLIELLVAIAIGAFVMGAVVQTLLSTASYRRQVEARVETHQGLRAAIDTLERDIRLAGACLPPLGRFVALEGVDQVGGAPPTDRDEITIRIGLLDRNGACIRTTLVAPGAAGGATLQVGSASGFAPDMQVYVVGPSGDGELLIVERVIETPDPRPPAPASPDTLILASGTTLDHPVSSGVYAIETRQYVVRNDLAGRSMLALGIDEDPLQPIVLGIESLDIRYRLRRNCPSCDVVPLPADDAEWRLVTDLLVDTTARSAAVLDPGSVYRVAESLRVKPRNLLP